MQCNHEQTRVFFFVVDAFLHRGSGGCLFMWLWLLCIESVSEEREREREREREVPMGCSQFYNNAHS